MKGADSESLKRLKLEGVFLGRFSHGVLRLAIVREVHRGMVDALGIGAGLEGKFFGCFLVRGEVATNFVEDLKEDSSSSFTRFNAWLVVGVDVHQRCVKSHRTLKECD